MLLFLVNVPLDSIGENITKAGLRKYSYFFDKQCERNEYDGEKDIKKKYSAIVDYIDNGNKCCRGMWKYKNRNNK